MTIFVFTITIMASRIIFYFVLLAAKSSIEKKVIVIGDNEAASKLVQHFRGAASLVRVEACFIDERISGNVDVPAIADFTCNSSLSPRFLREKTAFGNGSNSDSDKNRVQRYAQHERLLSRDLYIRSLVRGDINECLSFSIENEIYEIFQLKNIQ